LLAYHEGDYASAEKDFPARWNQAPPATFPYFFAAHARLRGGRVEFEELPEITRLLEKAVELNPQFAPAYATLANFYSVHPENPGKSPGDGQKAIELEPGNLNYATSYGFVLLNMGRITDAKNFASRIKAAARTLQDESVAAEFANAVASREASSQDDANEHHLRVLAAPESADRSIEAEESLAIRRRFRTRLRLPACRRPPSLRIHSSAAPNIASRAKSSAAECRAGGEVKLTLSLNSVLMKFRAAEWKTVEVTPANQPVSADKPPCAAWKGQRARVTFHSLPARRF